MSSTVEDRLDADHVKAESKKRGKVKSEIQGGTYYLYEACYKGVAKSVSEDHYPCEPTHLQSILFNLEEIFEAYLVGAKGLQNSDGPSDSLSDPRPNALIETLNETAIEIDRLVQNPDLFPSDLERERFYDELRGVAARFRKMLEIFDNFNQSLEKWVDSCADTYEQDRMPLRDRALKPWQQFLCQDAPGCHVHPNLLATPGSAQVISDSMSQILVRMFDKAGEIFRDIEIKHSEPPVDTRFKPDLIFPSISRRVMPVMNAVLPVNHGADDIPVRGREVQSLEILAEEFVCLDGRADNNVAHTGMTVLDRPEPE